MFPMESVEIYIAIYFFILYYNRYYRKMLVPNAKEPLPRYGTDKGDGMKKTFLFISAQYLPTMGGVERYTYNLARKVVSQGHRAIVATSSLEGLPLHETDSSGIEIFRLPSVPFMGGRLPLLRLNRKMRETAAELWNLPIDFCVINTYFYPLSMYAASQIRRRNIPAIIINHGSAWLMTGNKLLEFAGRIYEHTAARLCRHYCPHFYGVSAAAETWLRTFGISAEGTVTNAIEPGEIWGTCSAHSWREHLALPENAKVIAFVGRMIPEKGVGQMIAAMEMIRKEHPETVLVMAGTGPLLDQYQQNPPSGVYLPGGQPYPDVLALLQQADLFCLPSRSEGFACTVLEAAALGCPIVTTATGGSPQLLTTAEHGILLEDMEPATIAKACIQALSDEPWRRHASRITKQKVLENYTWDAAVQQLYRAFRLY